MMKRTLCGVVFFLEVTFTVSELSIPDDLDSWNDMTLFDKMEYLISPEDRNNKYEEYVRYGSTGGEDCMEYGPFSTVLSEFQSEGAIYQFWSYSDLNSDGYVCFEEYLYGRGEFEQNGNRYDFNEYEFVEKLMMDEIQRMIEDRRSEAQVYVYDESGIIIDQ